MTRLISFALIGVAVFATIVGNGGSAADARGLAPAACSPARVQYAPYRGGDPQLARMPWVGGKPRRHGLVGLLWYWPTKWSDERLRTSRIFVGGHAPEGYSTKILWTFVARSSIGAGGPSLRIRGTRLDAPGSFSQEFTAISFAGQNGAPSYASIVNVPAAGCWRLDLVSGELRAKVTLLAVDPA